MKVKVTFDDLPIFVSEERAKKWRMEHAMDLANEGKVPCTNVCICRSKGCHAECPAYLAYWEIHQEELKQRTLQSEVSDYVFKAIHRSKTSTREGREKYA